MDKHDTLAFWLNFDLETEEHCAWQRLMNSVREAHDDIDAVLYGAA